MTDNNKKSKRRKPGTPPGASPVLVKLEDKINIIKSWEHETPENLPLFVMPEAIESDGYYFAAHSRSDFKIVYTDILELESVGVNIWYDRAMEPSKDWRELARRMMNRQECKGVIVYGTVNSMASEPVQTELLVADELGKNIIFINHAKREKNPAAQILYEKAKMTFKDKCACVEGFEDLLARIGNANITYIDLALKPDAKKEKLDKIMSEEVLIYDDKFKSFHWSSVVGVKYLGVKSVEIPEKVTIDGNECELRGIGACAFANCRALERVVLPERLEYIGEHAFFGCEGLTKVHFGGSVGFVATNAFENCAKLEEVSVAEGNEDIIVKDRICYIHQPHDDDFGILFVPRDLKGDITLLDGLKSIKQFAFARRDGITSVTIPDSVTSIGDNAFAYCTSLTSVTIGNGVTRIGEGAFEGCTSLTSITIPDSVTSIGNYAFEDCTSLTSVTIGNGVESIGVYAFSDCASLASVTIGDGVESIGDYAFWKCKSLTSVTIPNSVTSIGNQAFYDCSSLTSVTIPDSVMSMGEGTFNRCGALRHVTFSGTAEQWKVLTKMSFGGWANGCPCEAVKCKDGEVPVTEHDRVSIYDLLFDIEEPGGDEEE